MSNKPTKHNIKAEAVAYARPRSRFMVPACACSAVLAGAMLFGTVPALNHSLAYADGYVDGTGNNIYYGYKTDASYTEARFHIEVDYYDTREHANAGTDEGKDPLGKYVRVHYLSNCNPKDKTADAWKFRPMWWYGVPKGLTNVKNITYTRIEKLTNQRGNQPFKPAGSSQFTFTDGEGYGVVSHDNYPTPKDWKGISNFYFEGDQVLASKGWKQLLGLNGGKYDNAGNTKGQWESYQKETAGLQGIFVDWESAGQRFYDMTYVGEMTDTAWKERHTNPLRFAAGVYRFAGNWHYAVGQKHNTPKIADHIDLKYPAVTLVKDPKNLQEAEQKTVKEAIEKANENTKHFKDFIADNGVVVNKDGSATITFKDQTTRTIPAALLVAKNEEDKDKYKPLMPARTPVVKPSQLTTDDKKAVIEAFQRKNMHNTDFIAHLKAGDDGIKFNDDGTKLVVTYQDGSTLEIPASELVRQGATIADWAAYAIPDTIEVDNLKHLSETEVNTIKAKFDAVNTGVKPYDEAKAKNGNTAPLTVDANTGNVTITWKDGSQTTIPGWQFLKEKAKQTPQPPAPVGEKTFFVETPSRLFSVNFDPLNMKADDLTNPTNSMQLDGWKDAFKRTKGKDSKDNSEVPITDVLYSVDGGKGYITFKAQGYKDRTYPMSVFFTKNVTPYNPSSSTVGPDSAGRTFIVKKYPIAGDTPTDAEKKATLKQFIETNWNNATVDGNSDSYTGGRSWTPKPDTSGIGTAAKDGHGITTISLGAGGDIVVKDDRGHTVNIVHDNLYEKNAVPKDTTIADLRAQAKDLLQKRKQEGLTDIDLMKSGIDNAANLNDPTSGIDSMNDQHQLRDLIRKLNDAKKAEYVYYSNPIEVDADPNAHDFAATDDQVQAAVKAFLKANYTDAGAAKTIDNYSITGNSGTFNNITWTPKAGTKNLEIKSTTMPSGIDAFTLNYDDGKSINFMHGDKVLFNVPADKLYKKKAETPAPTPDALAQMKKDAQQAIERNPNLTKDQKEQYKQQIKEAKTADKVKEILKNAAQQGKDNQNDPSKAQTITDNKGGGDAKKEAEEKQKEKEKEKEEKQKEQKLQDDKKNAENTINNMPNLSPEEKEKLKKQINGDSTPANPDGAKTPEAVQKILNNAQAINNAKGALQNDAAKGALPFLDHGNAADDKKDQPSHADDAALNELLGGTPGKDQTLTALEEALAKTNPTAEELNNAVTAAKKANALNEQKAKDAANRQLTAKKDALDNAYNALTDEQKNAAKAKYDAAIAAINTAKEKVSKATKPSEIKQILDNLKTLIDDANTAIKDAKGTRDTTGNTNDNADALNKEKKEQKKRIEDSDLPEADKKKAIEAINGATKLGDPTGIADRALKAKKIADALAAIDKLEHLNDAQKKAYKDIINTTDAHNIKDDDGKDTGKDDIDNALADAIATDTAMARLEKLKKKADDFKNEKDGKYSKLTNSDDDQNKKKAFDGYLAGATTLTTADKGDAKGADEVNTLYNDLLKAMQAIDPSIKGAGVYTDALSKEIEADKGLKPDDNANLKTPGKPLYTTASKEKQEAFGNALSDAEAALKKANDDNADQAKPGATPRTPEQEADAQKVVDDALQKLEEARKALDGVDTKPLENAIAAADPTHKTDKYRNADSDKQQAYDDAIKAAQQLLDKLTGKVAAGAGELTTKDDKQRALDAALKRINDAYNALNGHFSPGFRPSYPEDSTPQGVPGTGAGAGTGTGTGAGEGAGTGAGAGAQAGTGNGAGNSAGAGTGAGTGTGTGAGAGTDAGTGSGAGAASGAGVGTGSGAGAVDADAIKNAVQTTADATAPRNPGAMTDAQSPETSGATDAQGKHARLAKTADAAPVGAFALMTCAAAGLLGAGALRRKVRNARHSRR